MSTECNLSTWKNSQMQRQYDPYQRLMCTKLRDLNSQIGNDWSNSKLFVEDKRQVCVLQFNETNSWTNRAFTIDKWAV